MFNSPYTRPSDSDLVMAIARPNNVTSNWNGENRLVEMYNDTANLTFSYDCIGRRIWKKVFQKTRQEASGRRKSLDLRTVYPRRYQFFSVQYYVKFYSSKWIHSALQYQIPDKVCFWTCNRKTMEYSNLTAFAPIFQ